MRDKVFGQFLHRSLIIDDHLSKTWKTRISDRLKSILKSNRNIITNIMFIFYP